jgi:hypothetical protein
VVRLSRILKDYREAGAVNSLIDLWGFVDDTTFLTKAGAVGQVYRLAGTDACRTVNPDHRLGALHRCRCMYPYLANPSHRCNRHGGFVDGWARDDCGPAPETRAGGHCGRSRW